MHHRNKRLVIVSIWMRDVLGVGEITQREQIEKKGGPRWNFEEYNIQFPCAVLNFIV